MGISGLLPFLKNATRPTNIKEFRGQTVAIDSYCWLHKGAFSCADKLALGVKTDQYVYYCLKYVNTLLSYDIKVVMVFDGCHLPSKKDVEVSRRERRDAQKKKAAQLLRDGKQSEARDALRLSIDITSEMALNLMNACREKGVDCIVAPYEADAQLAYLNKIGIAQVIITEDSDLVLFGCEKVMYKMDFNGNGLLVDSTQINKTMDIRADLFTFEKFRYMCILSGCDYLQNLRGVGLKKAMSVFQLTRQSDMNVVLKKLPTTLNLNNITVGPDYIEGFFRANNTFLYQLVYDPMKRELLPLNPYPDDLDKNDVQYAGPYINQDVAYQLALGNLSVHNMKAISDFDPDTFQPKSRKWEKDSGLYKLSIWNNAYRPMSKIATSKQNAIDVQRKSTKGPEVTVNVKFPPKKSPVKRPRESNDIISLPSEKDLTMIYGDISNRSEESPAKRRKSNVTTTSPMLNTNQDKNMLNLLSDMLDQEEDCSNNTKSINAGSSVLECVTLQETVESSALKNETETNIDYKDKSVLTKNRFKVSNTGPKDNFKLNAAKTEVVSRFFTTTSKPFKTTSFYDQLKKDDSPDKPVRDPHKVFMYEDSNDPIVKTEKGDTLCNEQSNTNDDEVAFENEILPVQNTTTPNRLRGCGSFGVNSSKLDQFKSSFCKKSTDLPSSSNVCKQFKPVIDRSKLMKQEPNTTRVIISESVSSSQNLTSTLSYSTFSQSSIYSIDAESFGLSTQETHTSSLNEEDDELPDLVQTPSSSLDEPSKFSDNIVTNDTSTGLKKKKSLLFSKLQPAKKSSFYLNEPKELKENLNHSLSSDENSDGSKHSSEHSGQNMGISKFGSSPAQGYPKKKLSGCRSSGLTKNVAKNKSNSENQQASIKNFFTSFNYDNKNKDKLESTRNPLSPKKENV